MIILTFGFLEVPLIDKMESEKKKIYLLFAGLVAGIASLFFFKYCNFFIDTLVNSFAAFHIKLNIHPLKIILPLGISFYTFRSLSYLLDIKSGKIKPTTDAIVFFSYMSFFPSLISGPIDKARSFIPQLEKRRVFDYNLAADGMRQILWGLFKKVVIADNCDSLTNIIFDNYHSYSASTLVLGAFYFTIQIYADFSGYSDMAIGIAKLLGFNLTKNFDFPFFAQSIPEFWRKWHISLTSWMTEYVYTPISISLRDYGKTGAITAILVNFVLIGMWHGANWTFILFGLLNGLFFVPLIISGSIGKKKKTEKNAWKTILKLKNIVLTFIIFMLSTILFRANNVSQAIDYYHRIISVSLFVWPKNFSTTKLLLIFVFLLIEWVQQKRDHALQIENIKISWVRYGVYYSIIAIIIMMGHFSQSSFIYFKF